MVIAVSYNPYNGKEFDNAEMRLFCQNNNIKYIKSSPYHPQTNGSVEIIHKLEKDYLYNKKKQLGNYFDLEISLAEFVIYHNNKKHSTTRFIPNDIKSTEDKDTINMVLANIIKSLSSKIKSNEKNIKNGCFVLISTKITKKGNIYIIKNNKGKNYFRIPGIFRKFINTTNALKEAYIDFKNEFNKKDKIKCNLKTINCVDKFVFDYYLNIINNNSNIYLNKIFDDIFI